MAPLEFVPRLTVPLLPVLIVPLLIVPLLIVPWLPLALTMARYGAEQNMIGKSVLGRR